MKKNKLSTLNAAAIAMFLLSFSLILFELLLTRLFGIVLFAQFAQLVLALALLGISIGSVVQHVMPNILPEDDFEKYLAKIALMLGVSLIFAVLATVLFPLTNQFEVPPVVYQQRSFMKGKLLNLYWLFALLPFLLVPFVLAGIAFSGTFYRKKKHIGFLYGADLIGGAAGAVAFIPLLQNLAGPDVIFVALAAALLSATLLFRSSGSKKWFIAAGVAGFLAVVLSIASASGIEFFKIRYAAGYSEKNITYSLWTPLTRIAVHEDKRGKYIVLDNSSASEVLLTNKDRIRKSREINRSFVYRMHKPPARVAILASSAGPEVSIAQYYGYKNIDAIDIAGEIAGIVRKRFSYAPINPFIIGNTNQIKADGRAAILHSKEPYDIIQMVHANLHSSAGLMANAWSPSLLETKEAFATYLDCLSDKGTLSFGKSRYTPFIARAAAAAIEERGIEQPWRNIAYLHGAATFILVKKHAWTSDELDKLHAIARKNNCKFLWDPGYLINNNKQAKESFEKLFYKYTLLTDDKPYLDSIYNLGSAISRLFNLNSKGKSSILDSLYGTIVVQMIFILIAGLLFMFLPLLRKRSSGPNRIKNCWIVLAYVSCLGYAYLAVETVLIHELILFVGHPTYAVTIVILSMLLFSGIGSIVAGKIKEELVLKTLKGILLIAVVLASLQAGVFPSILTTYALGLPVFIRMLITFVLLAPLGFVMGMPFPLAIRIIPKSAAGIIPWAWALNGWMSVVATIASIIIARTTGYSYAFMVAIFFYVVALILAPFLKRVGQKVIPEEQLAKNTITASIL